jgi:hypothetical protein
LLKQYLGRFWIKSLVSECTTYYSVDVLDAAMGHSSSSRYAHESETLADGGITARVGKSFESCRRERP